MNIHKITKVLNFDCRSLTLGVLWVTRCPVPDFRVYFFGKRKTIKLVINRLEYVITLHLIEHMAQPQRRTSLLIHNLGNRS